MFEFAFDRTQTLKLHNFCANLWCGVINREPWCSAHKVMKALFSGDKKRSPWPFCAVL